MTKWICKVCEYTHYGAEAPERCPQCGAQKSQFYREDNNRGCIFGLLTLAFILLASCIYLMSCSRATTVDNSTVKSLDLNRFMGRWYEIARFDHKFERDMEQVTTMYSIGKNGNVKVVNQGLKGTKWKTSEGKGKLTTTPGLLRVSFWGPFYSDYRVMMLAPDYTYALIGGESDKYLWILSRSPQLKDNTLNLILNEATSRGYDTTKLIWVKQRMVQKENTEER